MFEADTKARYINNENNISIGISSMLIPKHGITKFF